MPPLLPLWLAFATHAQEPPADPAPSPEEAPSAEAPSGALRIGSDPVDGEVPEGDPNAVHTNYVAVVVGLNTYEKLAVEVALDFARSDAATVAATLRDQAGYHHVFTLTDRQATREGIRETIRAEVAQVVGPDDVLLFYFAGHGVGADLDLPTLLCYDSTLENGHEDGLELEGFARDLATWTRAGTTLIVTDAIHRNQLDGVFFYGPAADEWPPAGPNTMLLSSSSAAEPAKDGAFGAVFANAMAGAADIDKDKQITAGELTEYIGMSMNESSQTPVFAGTMADDQVIASSINPTASASIDFSLAYGDHTVQAAKFVFRDGASQTVQCRDTEIRACDSSCYHRRFKAGPCKVTAVVGGNTVKGTVLAMVPGLYNCGLALNGTLDCRVKPMGQ